MTEEYAKSEQISQPYYSLMPLPKKLKKMLKNGMMLIRMQVRDNLDGRPIIPISIMPTQSSIKKMKYQKEAKKILIN